MKLNPCRTANSLPKAPGFHPTPLAAAVVAVLVGGQMPMVLAGSSTCPAASAGQITIQNGTSVTAVEQSACILNANESLVVEPTGAIDFTQVAYIGEPLSTDGVRVESGVIANSINNQGLIRVLGDNTRHGVRVDGELSNSLINTGTITARSNGLTLYGYIHGDITNMGTLAGDLGYGIQAVNGSIIGGSLTNQLNATISGGVGISVSTAVATIVNAGQIIGTSGSGLELASYNFGTVTNEGTISGSGTAVLIDSATVGNFSNLGSTALIDGGQSGVQIIGGAVMNGTLLNEGTIRGVGTGLFAGGSQPTIGNLRNTGSILATQGGGIVIDGGEGAVTGSIDNSGIIEGQGSNGVGIAIIDNSFNVSSFGGFGGGITNSGTIRGTEFAIQNTSVALTGNISNSGLLDGKVALGTTGLILSGQASRVTGEVTGDAGSSVNVTGTFTTEDIFTIGSFAIANGGTLNLEHNITVTDPAGFNNDGVLAVGASAPVTMTGDYTQSTNGVFRSNIIDQINYGQLMVTGTAILPTNAKIDVNLMNPSIQLTAGRLENIISAGTLSSDGTFSVTDNSVLFDFAAVTDGGTVDLTLTAAPIPDNNPGGDPDDKPGDNPAPNPGGGPVTDPGSPVPPALTIGNVERILSSNKAARGAAAALDKVISAAPGGALAGLFVGLTTEKQVVDAVATTLPLLTSGSAQATEAALSSISKVIQARIDNNSGMSSGDAVESDRKLWMKPFGSWAGQDKSNGSDGYDSDTFGLGFGADATLNDRLRLGLAFAYAKANVTGGGFAQQGADIDVYQLIAYGSQTLAADTELNFQLGYGINSNQGKRILNIGNISGAARANYDSDTVTAGVGLAKRISVRDGMQILPSARIDYTLISDESYRENGGAAISPVLLDIDERDSDELVISLDTKIVQALTEAISIDFKLGVGYDALSQQASLTSTYAGAPGIAFTTDGIDPEPWSVHGGAGFNTNLTDQLDLGIQYEVEARAKFKNESASAKLRWTF